MYTITKNDVDMFKRIYIYITPIVIIDDPHMDDIEQNDHLDVFHLIKNMRNTACHHILVKEVTGSNLNENYIKELFINMVNLYRVFGLDLTENDKEVKKLWRDDFDDKFWFCENVLKQIDLKEIEKIKNEEHKDFYVYFKDLLDINSEDGMKLIYRYMAPIIVWYKAVEKQFKEKYENDLLFKIIFFTRHSVSHMTTEKDKNFKQIVQNINIIYVAFGIDLCVHRTHVKDALRIVPFKSKFSVSVKEEIDVNNETNCTEKDGDEIIREIRKILCDRNDKELNEKYFLFGKFLHYFVAPKIPNADMITQVFLNNENNIEWCDLESRFTMKDSENNLNRKKIFKLASPFFVWIEVVNKLEKPEYEETFYLSIKNIRERIIKYLKTNEDDVDEENDILQEIKFFYEPIEECFKTKENLRNYKENSKYSNLFARLCVHSVIGWKQRRFSYSYIFQYDNRQSVTDEMKNEGKMFDILNFCGLFYIYISLFEENETREFYTKVKQITDQITDYMKEEIKIKIELEKKIIDELKLVLPATTDQITDFMIEEMQKTPQDINDLKNKISNEISSVFDQSTGRIIDYMGPKIKEKIRTKNILQNKIIAEMINVFRGIDDRIKNRKYDSQIEIDPQIQTDPQNKTIFSQIYSHIVKSRAHVQISFIDKVFEERIGASSN